MTVSAEQVEVKINNIMMKFGEERVYGGLKLQEF